jgi:drug/metabolite transporter (DMT)-like permease
MGSNAKGALLALLAFGVYATHDVVVKFMGGTYNPAQLIFFSVLFSFPLAMLMMMRDPNPGTLLPVHPWWIALRTGASVLTGISAFYAFKVLPLAQVYTIVFATPLLITMLSIPILGEKVRIRRWMAVIVGLLGVLVVLRPGSTELTLGHGAALLAAVGGSVCGFAALSDAGELCRDGLRFALCLQTDAHRAHWPQCACGPAWLVGWGHHHCCLSIWRSGDRGPDAI